MPATLLIVDDHPGFRDFMWTLFEGDQFEVIGEAVDGESALRAVRELHPDVVLLDVQLPGIDGFEVASRLVVGADPPKVVLTSTREASDYGSRLREAPVLGFLPKRLLSPEALAELIADGKRS